MKKLGISVLAMAAVLAMAIPSNAKTILASCSGTAATGCSKVFIAGLNLDTVNVRVIPGTTFAGSVETQIFEVGNISNEVHYQTTWATGRILLDGDLQSAPYQLLAGHTYEVIAVTNDDILPASTGSLSAVAEV